MKFVSQCKFLKVELLKSKDKTKEYMLIALLDDEMNSHKFFVFNEDLKKKIVELGLKELDLIDCAFEVQENQDNGWRVNLLDLKRVVVNGK